jgi:hypothetical protein
MELEHQIHFGGFLMADNNTFTDTAGRRSSEPICIDASRVYDSCGDKDCLADLPVFFTEADQRTVDTAVNVRLRSADVLNVMIDTEPVPFHKGFYSIDITYFFLVTLDVFTTPTAAPGTVSGVCVADKKVILYGSEGNVRVFSSEYSGDEFDPQNLPSSTMPIANVQVAQPIALAASVKEKCACHRIAKKIPVSVASCLGGALTDNGEKIVLATLGVFSIVQLMRNVQMLIPSYDYCIPEKSCTFSADSPCEMFSRLDFPTDEFFPPNVGELAGETGCGCMPCSDTE